MSSIDLFLLGFIINQAMSAYEFALYHIHFNILPADLDKFYDFP